MRRKKAQSVCACLFLCLCVLCIFVHSPAIKPSCSQVMPSVFVCLHRFVVLFPRSLTLGLIHASAGQRGGPLVFWRKCHRRHQWNTYFASSRHREAMPSSALRARRKAIRLVGKYADIQVQSIDIWCLLQCWEKLNYIQCVQTDRGWTHSHIISPKFSAHPHKPNTLSYFQWSQKLIHKNATCVRFGLYNEDLSLCNQLMLSSCPAYRHTPLLLQSEHAQEFWAAPAVWIITGHWPDCEKKWLSYIRL